MCTLAVAWGTHPRFPLLVVANRDEFYGRAATPPVVHSERPRIVGGRDLEKNGTWFAVRPDGFFCGLTNRRPEAPPNPSARSRGEIVLEVLRAAQPDDAAKFVAGLDARDYNGFNLLFGTAERLYTASVWPWLPAPEVSAVAPGVHVLPTSRLDAADYPKVARLRAHLEAPLPEDWPALRGHLQAALADHTQPPPEAVGTSGFFPVEMLCALDALCIHLPAHRAAGGVSSGTPPAAGYGTRSSSLLALAPGRVLHAEHAEGAPCTHAYAPYDALLRGDG